MSASRSTHLLNCTTTSTTETELSTGIERIRARSNSPVYIHIYITASHDSGSVTESGQIWIVLLSPGNVATLSAWTSANVGGAILDGVPSITTSGNDIIIKVTNLTSDATTFTALAETRCICH